MSDKVPAVTVVDNYIVVKGQVTWSELKEAKAFSMNKPGTNKGKEVEDDKNKKPEKKNFSISLIIPSEDAEKVAGAFNDLGNKIFAEAKKGFSPAEKVNAKYVQGGFKYHVDKKTDEVTGEITTSFRRPENSGRPLVRGENGEQLDLGFLPKGTTVLVRAIARPYGPMKSTGQAGVSYTLLDVRVVDSSTAEDKSGLMAALKTPTDAATDALMGGNISDAPMESEDSAEDAPY